MVKKTMTAAMAATLLAGSAGAQMVAKPTTARPATSAGGMTKPIGSNAGASKGQAIGSAVKSATITITQPMNNGDTLRVSTGGEYQRCGFAPGTQVPQGASNPLAAAASAAVAGVQNSCTLSVPKGSAVALRIIYAKYSMIAAASNGWQLAGGQWGGDCAGTTGDTCMLDMSQNRAVKTDTAAAGGIEIPMGQAAD